jgi:predicted RNA polymerase sigma factor
MAFGPEAGLRLLNAIADTALPNYAPLPAARGDLLFRCGRLAEARAEFQAAARLTRNAREADYLLARADSCGSRHRPKPWRGWTGLRPPVRDPAQPPRTNA